MDYNPVEEFLEQNITVIIPKMFELYEAVINEGYFMMDRYNGYAFPYEITATDSLRMAIMLDGKLKKTSSFLFNRYSYIDANFMTLCCFRPCYDGEKCSLETLIPNKLLVEVYDRLYVETVEKIIRMVPDLDATIILTRYESSKYQEEIHLMNYPEFRETPKTTDVNVIRDILVTVSKIKKLGNRVVER